MKHFLTILLTGLLFLSAFAARAADRPLLQIHFAGAQKIGADPQSAAVGPVFNCPEAKALTAQTLDKLARFPRVWLKDYLPSGADNGTGLLRPLFDDLLVSEWYLSAQDAGHAKPDFALAIQPGAGRDRLWLQNLSTLVSNWLQTRPQTVAGVLTWPIPGSTAVVRLEQSQGWTFLSVGQNASPLNRQMLGQGQSPWLSVDADWQQISKRWPDLGFSDLPVTHLEVKGHDKDLVVTVRAMFAEPVITSLPAWQIPEKLIRSQFVSFTAVRGFAPWLQKQAWYQPYAIDPAPDQAFVWAAPKAPFQTFAALAVPSASSAMAQYSNRLQTGFQSLNASNYFITKINPVPAPDQLQLSSLPPFVAPFLKPWQEAAGQFIYAGLFTGGGRPVPFPPGLRTQLVQPNLALFHWEITAERLPEFLQVSQFSLAVTKHRQLGANSAALKWINRIGPTLGNSITVVTAARPNELLLTRTAPAGLTAAELYALADWLEAPDFPGCDLKMPVGPRKLHPHPPGSPAPAPGGFPLTPPSH